MLAIFRTNQTLIGVFLLFYVLLLRGLSFWAPVPWEVAGSGILTDWLYRQIGDSTFWPSMLGIILLFVQGFFLNTLVNDHRLNKEQNQLPGLFYIFLSSCLVDFLHLSPLIIANGFLMIALRELMLTYKKYSAADRIFNVGFWVATASLFYWSYAIFLLLGFFGLGVFRAFKLKERFMIVLGFLCPYILWSAYFFWYDLMPVFWQEQVVKNTSFLDFAQIPHSYELYLKLGLMAFLLLLVLVSYRRFIVKTLFEVQKKINVVYLPLIITVLTVLFQSQMGLEHFLILMVPMGILVSFWFTNLSKSWAELLHLLCLIGILLSQYLALA